MQRIGRLRRLGGVEGLRIGATDTIRVGMDDDFAGFYREAYPGAVRLAWLLTHDHAGAEDVVQDAFLRLRPRLTSTPCRDPASSDAARPQMGRGVVRYYEDFEPGRVWEYEGRYELTEAEIVEVGRRWDPQSFHTDPVAAESSIFGGLVASSVHLFAVSTCLAAQVPDDMRTDAISALGFRMLRLHAPARPGDVIRLRSTARERRPSKSRPGTGIVVVGVELFNQHDELVFEHESSFLVRCRRP